MNEETIIEILRFGAKEIKFSKQQLIDHLPERLSEYNSILDNFLTIYFEPLGGSDYRIKPDGYITLFNYDNLEQTKNLTREAQRQAIAAQRQAVAAENEAQASLNESRRANNLSRRALWITIISLVLTLIASVWQICLSIEANQISDSSLQISKEQINSDVRLSKETLSKIVILKDTTLSKKLDRIIELQEEIIKKKK